MCFVCVCAQREVILDSSASIFQFENIYMGLSFIKDLLLQMEGIGLGLSTTDGKRENGQCWYKC